MTTAYTASVYLVGDSADFDAAMEQASAAADEAAGAIDASFDAASAQVEAASSRMAESAAAGAAGMSEDLGAAGLAAGAAAADGMAVGTAGLADDVEGAGRDAGAALKDGVVASTSDMADELAGAGLLAGTEMGGAVEEGASGLEGDLASKGETAGASLGSGAAAGIKKSTKTFVSKVGEWAASGVAALGAVAIDFADSFDKANVSLQTAISATGDSTKATKPAIDATYSSMAQLGFNSTTTANALSGLVTSTGSVTKATGLMADAADLARFKHISLATAASLLQKIMAGSNRAITQMGLNLDIGSGKLSSIQTATEGVKKAQLELRTTQDKIADGAIKAATAEDALKAAHMDLSNAEQKLAQDHGTIAKILDTLHEKTKNAADGFSKTLPGSMDVSRAELHNLGSVFGEWLSPKLTDAVKGLTAVVGWLDKHKAAAEALAGVIGGVLSIAIAVFVEQKLAKLAKDIRSAVTDIQKFGSKIGTLVGKLGNLGSSTSTAADEVAASSAETEASFEGISTAAATTSAEVGASMDGMAAGMSDAAPEVEAAGDEIGEGIDSAFGPIGLALAAVMVVVELMVTHWKTVKAVLLDIWHAIKDAAEAVWDGIKAVFNGFVDFLKKWGPLILEAMLVPFTGGMSLILPTVIQHWDAIARFFSEIPADIEKVFSAAASWLVNAGRSVLTGLWNGAKAVWTDVSGWVGSLGSKILHLLADAGSWLIGIGKSILEGLLHGIEDGVGDVLSGIKSVGSKIVGAFKSVLSIFSPSRVFHDLGGNIMQGLANGIAAGTTTATKAISAAAHQLETVPFHPPVLSPLSIAGGVTPAGIEGAGIGAGGGSPGTSNQNTTNTVIINASTNANPGQIAAEVGWALRTHPAS